MTVSVTVDIEKSNAEGTSNAREEISSLPKPVEQTALLTTEEQSQVIKKQRGLRLSFLLYIDDKNFI